jgi:hypothetical protein
MESNKDSILIADYSVSQTTLDQVFINFAKTQRGKDSDDEDEDEMEEDGDSNSNNGDENAYYNQRELKNINGEKNLNTDQITVNIPTQESRFDSPITDEINNHTPSFESIKNHFNSFKKKGHIRKTSSAKSMQRKQSTRSRKSEISRSSSKRRKDVNESGGFNNLAYEIEFKNSDSYPPYQYDVSMQEASHDLTTSLNEDGEYFSRC